MEKLKPCPFCGSKATAFSEFYGCDHHGQNVWRAWCGCSNKECDAGFELFWQGDDLLGDGDGDHTCNALVDRAIELWNCRADECDRDELSKLADELHICSVAESNIGASNMLRELSDRIRKAIGEE